MTDVSTLARRDREHASTSERIRKYGVSVSMIGGPSCPHCIASGQDCAEAGPSFAYTVGLFGTGHPEILIYHDSPAGASALLNGLARRVFDGEPLAAGQYVDYPGTRHRGYAEDLPNPGEVLVFANDFYQRPPSASVPALQVTFSDHTGRMPWQPGYHGDPAAQPRPGRSV